MKIKGVFYFVLNLNKFYLFFDNFSFSIFRNTFKKEYLFKKKKSNFTDYFFYTFLNIKKLISINFIKTRNLIYFIFNFYNFFFNLNIIIPILLFFQLILYFFYLLQHYIFLIIFANFHFVISVLQFPNFFLRFHYAT